MAKDVTINGVDYPDVPAVQVPLTSGVGTALYLDAADYRTAAEQDMIDAGKIGDAPTDGKQYARKDGAWTEVTGGGGSGAYVSGETLIFTAAVVSGETLIL